MRRNPWGYRVAQRLSAWAIGVSCVVGAAPPLLWAAMAFQESGGQVVIEAERYDSKIPRNGKDWVLKTSQSGYSGSGYLTALPNSGSAHNTGYTTKSPELVYNVSFTTTGTYYLWVRAVGPSGLDDSVHAGIDGTGPNSADRIHGFYGVSVWVWKSRTMDGSPPTLLVSKPGLHTIHLWMREDGFKVDKILLRTDSSSTAPSGTGPAESPRVSVGGDTTAPTVSLTAPAGGATVSGTVTVSATASDNVGVVGVQFKLDGANLGAEDTTGPYGVSWDTTTAVDGSHTLTAVARDAAGNTKMATAVTVTVANDRTPPVISGLTVSGITATSATLSWTTDEMASCWANHYCPPGTMCIQVLWFATGPGTNHRVTLSDLMPGTHYQFPIYCTDAASNKAEQRVDFSTQADTTPPAITFTSPTDGQILAAP